jgi:hypothetical protein
VLYLKRRVYMKRNSILVGVMASVLLLWPVVSHAEKWDKNDYASNVVESGYYDADSVKVQGKTVTWTEKYLYTNEGIKNVTAAIAKNQACKQSIATKGEAAQAQVDYQIEGGKSRGAAKRYYNKSNDLLCTNKDLGEKDFNTSWNKIVRHSPMEEALYDLVNRYKVTVK